MTIHQQPEPFSGAGPCLRDLGESAVIERIRRGLDGATPPSPAGIGDDCAVFAPITHTATGHGLATVDAVTLAEHFTANCPPQQVGRKLVHRNVSDIAAMGGRPQWALLTLLCGGDLRCDWLDAFIIGVRDAASDLGMQIVGGDVSALPAGLFSAVMTIHGYAETPILRSTAKAGDAIWVTGVLGGSIAGHHLTFNARVDEGNWLAQHAPVTAMMDISDGLGKDLPALLPASCVAALELSKIPISTAAFVRAEGNATRALQAAFSDGEDYELLFCTPSNNQDWLALWQQTFPNTQLTRIGYMQKLDVTIPAKTLFIDSTNGLPLDIRNGYEHFHSG